MAAGVDRQAQLGADAIGAGDQHWLFVALGQFHERAEAADAGQHFRALRALYNGFDALNKLVAGVDVDARVSIGETGAFFHSICVDRPPY